MDVQPRAQVACGLHVPAAQARMIRALYELLRASPRGRHGVELIETHISWVLIAGDRAWKLKKAIAPGFLDFTSLARRRHFCEEELRLNRRLAPALYLDVVPITGSAAAPKFDGEGRAIDWAVAMRAFDREGQWDRLAARGALRAQHVDKLVERIARLHEESPAARVDSGFGSPPLVRSTMLDTLRALQDAAADAAAARTIERLKTWEAATYPRLEAVFASRAVDGRVRECHGDLHLGNVAEIDGQTVAFDGIEFDPSLRWIDVTSEVAFMAMDLAAHGLPGLAHRFANAYCERSGDYGGLRAWHWYFVYRALVRARVAAMRGAAADMAHYLALADDAAQARQPALIATHGFSGSGKSTLATALVETLGAIRLRADIERRRAAGLDAFAHRANRPDSSLYSPAMNTATYERLLALAAPALEGGLPVVLDATFLARAQRDRARAVASRRGVPWILLDLQADRKVLRERVNRRATIGDDPSEADLAVLERQFTAADPIGGDECDDVLVCHDGVPDGGWQVLRRRLAGRRCTAGVPS